MARQYTIGPQLAGDIILIAPQNNEINQAVGELNGSLDQNNMPLDSVDRSKLIAPVVTVIAADPAQNNYVYQTQAVYIAEKCTSTVSIPVTQWSVGWNAFEAAATSGDRTGFVLNFTAQEGMLKGEAVLDFENRQSYFLYRALFPDDIINYQDGANIRDEHTGELGVFVNDVLVARTGPLWIACGRHTYTIPYATPVKSGPVKVDVRWLISYFNVFKVLFTDTLYFPGVNQVYPVQVYSRQLWCRNQYR